MKREELADKLCAMAHDSVPHPICQGGCGECPIPQRGEILAEFDRLTAENEREHVTLLSLKAVLCYSEKGVAWKEKE